MSAISFQRGFLDALLRGDKQQTTRRQTNRIKVGDVCNIYIDQRNRIRDKPLRQVTCAGAEMVDAKLSMLIDKRTYPSPTKFCGETIEMDTSKLYYAHGLKFYDRYHAHFLGKVAITEVYDMCPCDNSARSAWAKADGFTNFGAADKWFTARYGEDWYLHLWTVIKWNGWAERYFEPER